MIVADTKLLVCFYVSGDYTELAVEVYAKDSVWISPLITADKKVLCEFPDVAISPAQFVA